MEEFTSQLMLMMTIRIRIEEKKEKKKNIMLMERMFMESERMWGMGEGRIGTMFFYIKKKGSLNVSGTSE